MKLKKKLWPLLLLVAASGLVSLPANEPDPDHLAQRGIELAYNLKLDEADDIFDRIIAQNPDSPQGYVLKAVILYYRYVLDESTSEIEKEFNQATKQAIERSNQNFAKNQKDVDALFYAGTAHIYLAAFHGEKENWMKALWNGKKAIDYLERAVEIDSTYYDAYFGLGVYHYYADVLPSFVKTATSLFGVDADRQGGLRELRMAALNGTFAKAEAAFFLGKIYAYSERDYEKAHEYFKLLGERYPMNPGFLIDLGESQRRLGQHENAIKTFERALAVSNGNSFPIFTKLAYYDLGNVYYELNDFDKAIEIYHRAISHQIPTAGANKWIDGRARYKIGLSYELSGDRRQAEIFYRSVQKRENKRAYESAQQRLKNPYSPINIDIMHGENNFKTRKYGDALQIYNEIMTKIADGVSGYPQQKLARIHYEIARVYFKQENYDAAIAELNKALSSMNDHVSWIEPWAHFYLGNCYRRKGEIEKALAEYDTAYDSADRRLRFQIDRVRESLSS